jgi:hypothetical protein
MYRTFPVINLQQQQPVKAMVPGTIKQQHAGGFLGKAHFLLGSSRVELSVELVYRSKETVYCSGCWTAVPIIQPVCLYSFAPIITYTLAPLRMLCTLLK